MYSSPEMKKLRQFVDRNMNGEDIFMNGVVSHYLHRTGVDYSPPCHSLLIGGDRIEIAVKGRKSQDTCILSTLRIILSEVDTQGGKSYMYNMCVLSTLWLCIILSEIDIHVQGWKSQDTCVLSTLRISQDTCVLSTFRIILSEITKRSGPFRYYCPTLASGHKP